MLQSVDFEEAFLLYLTTFCLLFLIENDHCVVRMFVKKIAVRPAGFQRTLQMHFPSLSLNVHQDKANKMDPLFLFLFFLKNVLKIEGEKIE